MLPRSTRWRAGRYVDCASDGTPNLELHCALGCSPDVEKCIDVAPSNNLASLLDEARDDQTVQDVAFSGDSIINTMTGQVFNGPNLIEVRNETAGDIEVFLFRSLTVTGTLKIVGDAPVALVVDGDVMIMGLVDISADRFHSGARGI